jgi:hypothetical protein
MLGIDPRESDSIPFSVGDVTAGSETELQVAVAGSATTVDLPLSIRSSNYFQNVVHRAAVGDTSRRSITRLEHWPKHGHQLGNLDSSRAGSPVNSRWCVSDPLARFARVSPSRGGDYACNVKDSFSPSVRGRAAEGGRGSLTHHLEVTLPSPAVCVSPLTARGGSRSASDNGDPTREMHRARPETRSAARSPCRQRVRCTKARDECWSR